MFQHGDRATNDPLLDIMIGVTTAPQCMVGDHGYLPQHTSHIWTFP